MSVERSYRSLVKKYGLLGLEGIDIFLVTAVLIISAYINTHTNLLSDTSMWFPPVILFLLLYWCKKGKPKGFLIDGISNYFTRDVQFAYCCYMNHKRPQNIISKMKSSVWSDSLPYIDLREDLLFKEDGTATLFVEIYPVVLENMTDKQRIELQDDLHNFLLNIEEMQGCSLYYYTSNDFRHELKEFTQEKSDIPVLREIREMQAKELEEKIKNKKVKKSRIVLEKSFRTNFKIPKFSIFGSAERKQAIKNMKGSILKAEQAYEQIEISLKSAGLSFYRMNTQDIFRFLYESINPGRFHKMMGSVRYKDWIPLKQQLMFSDRIAGTKDKIDGMFYLSDEENGFYHSVITMTVLPETLNVGEIMEITKLDSSRFSIKMNWFVPRKATEIKNLKSKRDKAEKTTITWKMTLDNDAQALYEDLEELIEVLTKTNEKVFYIEFIVRTCRTQ